MDKKSFFGSNTVWYHPEGVVNVKSLKTLKKLHRVTYDSADGRRVFKVHTPRGKVKFKLHENGLHYIYLKEEKTSGITLVTTVRERTIKGSPRKRLKVL